MATRTPEQSIEAGTQITFHATSSGGDDFANSGKEIILINNASGSAVTVTVEAHLDTADVSSTNIEDTSYGTLTKANVAKSCATGQITSIGPFKPAGFNDSSGKVNITYSATTSVTIGFVQVYE
jgi:hypothetical protein